MLESDEHLPGTPQGAVSDLRAIKLGTFIGERYKIVSVLGFGGMGAVYEATDVRLGEQVALKVMLPRLASSPVARQRFLREAETARRLQHPAVVRIHDAQEHDGSAFIAFELLQGRDLATALIEGSVSPRRLVEIAGEVLELLEAAHSLGMVHRDIKPSNIFLAESPEGERIKVLDFGIAKDLEGKMGITATDAILGTPGFMAPEQVGNEGVDGRSDLWAVGAVLFFGLTGRTPIVAESTVHALQRLMTESPPSAGEIRPELPSDIVAVIDRSLRLFQHQRFGSAHEMLTALKSCDMTRLEALKPVSRIHSSDSDPSVPVANEADFTSDDAETTKRDAQPAPNSPWVGLPRVEETWPDPVEAQPAGTVLDPALVVSDADDFGQPTDVQLDAEEEFADHTIDVSQDPEDWSNTGDIALTAVPEIVENTPPTRRPLLLASAGGVILLAVSAVAWLLTHRAPAEPTPAHPPPAVSAADSKLPAEPEAEVDPTPNVEVVAVEQAVESTEEPARAPAEARRADREDEVPDPTPPQVKHRRARRRRVQQRRAQQRRVQQRRAQQRRAQPKRAEEQRKPPEQPARTKLSPFRRYR